MFKEFKPFLDIQDVNTDADFWAIHVTAAYDPKLNWDNDPHGEFNIKTGNDRWVLGWTLSKQGNTSESKTSPIVVFTETIRDVAKEKVGVPGAVTEEVLRARVVAHESVHAWGIYHYPKELPNGEPDPYSVAILGVSNNWRGADADNMLATIHIAVIRSAKRLV